jgi:hypothetical protein
VYGKAADIMTAMRLASTESSARPIRASHFARPAGRDLDPERRTGVERDGLVPA